MNAEVNLIFVAFGDSLTRGFTPFSTFQPFGQDFPYTSHLDNIVLAELSKRNLDYIKVKFVNLGLNGDTTGGMLHRFNTQVTPIKPNYVIVWGGINDLYNGIRPNVVMENLKKLYKDVRNLGARPVACTLSSILGFDDMIPAILELNSMISEHCNVEGIHVVDLFKVTSNADGKLRKEYSSDGIHMTNEGYARVASAIYLEIVCPILKEYGS